ncbi:hypothetical protein EV702DRAFT_452827 [Suillus placidus]|uniref:Uncharacterized protein n=1 Tax=Suillus placidus TaxID=48579 RepID=A0A9P7D122_9AGAM|nr:hypothetical protein EV702DRAFT_452827 [Suillus placidus]
MHSLLYILYLSRVIQAAPTTKLTTTSDCSEGVSSVGHRTLWSIVSTCILTLLACIYSSTHPNIPSPKDRPVRILLRRFGIMGLALLSPDLLVAWAIRQWLWARYVTAQFKGHFSARRLQEPSEIHDGNQTLVAHVDGEPSGPVFLLQFHTLAGTFKKWLKGHFSEQPEDYTWTQTHSFFALMGGFMLYVDGEPYLTLSPDHLLDLIRAGSIDAPALTARQISDRSKGNAISKGLIIFQGTWFILQLLSRAICHLAITHIEVATLAFAVLNFIVYAVWWNKPLDVQCPHPVYWKSTESKPEIIPRVSEDDLPMPSEIIVLSVVDSCLQMIGIDAMSPRRLHVPTFDDLRGIKFQPWESNVLTFAGFTAGAIFGGIHCTAWFYVFPTYQEQVLWRMSAITITCSPLLCFVVALVLFRSGTEERGSVRYKVLLCMGLAEYLIARIILFLLMFTTLRNLPSNAYKVVSWSTFLPHL